MYTFLFILHCVYFQGNFLNENIVAKVKMEFRGKTIEMPDVLLPMAISLYQHFLYLATTTP